ncbi:hypothetical protein PoB_001354500 [Plakobranchus ocellatus]|uniref:ShKT domain-containing protein n=1 Tax=Plakobranchus ocellatus TaxID=259542 RepID=A0AAV3YX42_9GAST|nr:hypothetical protein PoB_001354500 [Plakobranchus ocellatus]
MVWDHTSLVGCYAKRCPLLRNVEHGKNAWFLACLYSPRGNIAILPPYTRNCGRLILCHDGQQRSQDRRLCLPQERDFLCEDHNMPRECRDYERQGMCHDRKRRYYVNRICLKTCKKCTIPCSDKSVHCSYFTANVTMCISYKKDASMFCRKSCDLCHDI